MTPDQASAERRLFLARLTAMAGATALGACGGEGNEAEAATANPQGQPPTPTPAPTPAPGPVPAWVSALALGQWYQIPSSTWSSVQYVPVPNGNSGPQAKADAWNSLVVDPATSRVYNVAAGGHYDYAGNEVEYLDLSKAAPNWVRVLDPTPAAYLREAQSYYADGRPCSRHSYFGLTYDPTGRRLFLLGGSVWGENSGLNRAIDSYSIETNAYSPAGSHPSWSVNNEEISAVCANPENGDVYVLNVYQLGRWRPSTNTWTTNLNPSGSVPSGQYACSAYDTKRGRAFFLGGTANISHIYTPATNAMAAVSLTGAAAGSVRGDERGMVYVSGIDAFLVRARGAGATVYRIDAATFQCTALATTGGGSIPATLNGPYNKFLYVPQLGGVVYVPAYDGNAWFLRLH